MKGDRHGLLRSGITRQRKIDEWKFQSPFNETRDVLVTVSVEKKSRMEENGFEFVAEATAFKQSHVEFKSTNLDTLYKKVFDYLSEQDIVQHKVVWDDWFEVKIYSATNYADDPDYQSCGVTIEIQKIKRGTRPDTDAVYQLLSNNCVVRFPDAKAAGEDDIDHGENGRYFHSREKDYQYSYIKATPENTLALDNLVAAFAVLRTRLDALLNQKAIQKSLKGELVKLLPLKS